MTPARLPSNTTKSFHLCQTEMFLTRRTLETLHQRLTNDFLAAEALSSNIPRDEKTPHLPNSSPQSDITRRQARLIMQLRDFLVAKGEVCHSSYILSYPYPSKCTNTKLTCSRSFA